MDEQISEECLKIETGLCRCCHGEGSFKTLGVSCFNNEEQVFSDILLECLDINITPVPGPLFDVTYSICDVCILKLQDAFNFKKQVMVCEERFRDMYRRNAIKVVPVKIETQETDVKPENADSYHADDHADNDANDNADMDDFMGFSHPDDIHLDMELQNDKDDVRKKEKKAKGLKDKTKTSGKNVKKVGRPRKNPDEEEKKQKKGGKASTPRFRLLDNDFKMDGNDYVCSHCDRKYHKKFSLRFHVKTKHYKIPRFVCPYCSKEFMTVAPLTIHKLEEHRVDDRFKCKACSGIFNTKIQLRKHINNFHMLGEKYKCEFCEYESFSFEGMYKHKFKHKAVKDYQCRFCRKPFLRKATLDLHERIHTGDRRKVCKVCGQAFVQKASLNYHMTKYHPEVNF